MGVLAGRVILELETPEKAKEELSSLSYTGAPSVSKNTNSYQDKISETVIPAC